MPRANGRRNAKSWMYLRRRILDRDDSRCCVCGRGGSRFEIHHLVGTRVDGRQDDSPENLQTQCRSCHIKTHGERLTRVKQPGPDWGGFLNGFMADLTPTANCTKAK